MCLEIFLGGADLRRGTNGGEGGYFMRIFIIKYCCWVGRCGARDLARGFWLQSGLFYKNGGRNIFEFGAPIGLKGRGSLVFSPIFMEIFFSN